ncbi:MAG: helix-turn-helix transcriptional regulator [Pseudomonadota bacterium]|nr:helix-turn-helix transcriptional regulator [Pseudomonadota bacterium]
MAKKSPPPTAPPAPTKLTRTLRLSGSTDAEAAAVLAELSAMPQVQSAQVTSIDAPPLADAGLEPGEGAYVWNRNPEFPAYLRQVREKSGISIRQAAPALGISVPYLSRLETAGAAKSPDMRRLCAMADLYGIDRRELLHHAGMKLDLPRVLPLADRTDEQFARMLLDPALKPPLLNEEVLHFVAPRLKAQLIQWALHLVMQENPRAYLNSLLSK